MQRLTMAAMIPVPVQSKGVSISGNDREDEDKKVTDLQSESRFPRLLGFSVITVLINYLFFFCFYMVSVVELFAWKSKFNNSSDPAVEGHFNRIQTSTRICLLINSAVPLLLILGVCGPRGWIYVWRRLIRPHILLIVSLGLNVFLIFSLIICPSKEAQTLVTTIFLDDYSLSHVPRAISILESISITFAGQHLMLLFLLNRNKPPHFCLPESDNNETSPSNIIIDSK